MSDLSDAIETAEGLMRYGRMEYGGALSDGVGVKHKLWSALSELDDARRHAEKGADAIESANKRLAAIGHDCKAGVSATAVVMRYDRAAKCIEDALELIDMGADSIELADTRISKGYKEAVAAGTQ